MLIFKIFRDDEWKALQEEGVTKGAPVDLQDGFIHFSAASQVQGTLDKHFRGASDLWLIACRVDPLGASLRWEVSRGGAAFPHLYRDLRMEDVDWARPITAALIAGLQ